MIICLSLEETWWRNCDGSSIGGPGLRDAVLRAPTAKIFKRLIDLKVRVEEGTFCLLVVSSHLKRVLVCEGPRKVNIKGSAWWHTPQRSPP